MTDIRVDEHIHRPGTRPRASRCLGVWATPCACESLEQGPRTIFPIRMLDAVA